MLRSALTRTSPALIRIWFPAFRRISSSANSSSVGDSYTACYLENKCGLSNRSASRVSGLVQFDNPEKPDSVLSFLNSHGFSGTQIKKVVRRAPRVLLCNPGDTLLPKIQFFLSKGISTSDLANFLSSRPDILYKSLEHHIIPAFDVFKNVLRSDEKVLDAISLFPSMMANGVETHVVPNLKFLREIGLPESRIVQLIELCTGILIMRSSRLAEIVEQVKEMGFSPSKQDFILAIRAVKQNSKLRWEKKIGVYESWGWSREETLGAFKRRPWIMMVSENKIMAIMDFFVNKMGCESSLLAQSPAVFSLSLEKRIMPRYAVIQVLQSKGVIKLRNFFVKPLLISEEMFLQKYIMPYEQEASDLLQLYEEKKGLATMDTCRWARE